MATVTDLQQTIYLNDAGSVMRWCVLLDTNCLALAAAVNAVGTDAGDVRQFLLEKRKTPTRRESRGVQWVQKFFGLPLKNSLADSIGDGARLNVSVS